MRKFTSLSAKNATPICPKRPQLAIAWDKDSVRGKPEARPSGFFSELELGDPATSARDQRERKRRAMQEQCSGFGLSVSCTRE